MDLKNIRVDVTDVVKQEIHRIAYGLLLNAIEKLDDVEEIKEVATKVRELTDKLNGEHE
ncbi:hypothetical protein H7S74_30290 [Priestia aryabhattai]|uniref:hypothetical protein n=1 Tax=Priestia aryabhattai TaxID=412384 RepID=UPI001ECB1A7B|nr:hypothetical protein [Priestia aryabhattai]MBY0094927.1 hypothetical protein [Priestia aryabhattai]MBY0105585.1 hypothetical protein [Priestia aryabhattai]